MNSQDGLEQKLRKDLGQYRSFSRGFEKSIYDWAISRYD